MSRLPSEWRNYCIYSGKTLPDAALNDEHVIPKSLGGYRSTVIRTSKDFNAKFANTIDARICNDAMIQFGRRDANAKGHSGKAPKALMRGARAWKRGDPWGEGEIRYNIEVNKIGPTRVFDTKTGKYLEGDVFSDTGFIIPNMKIDHVARLRFTAKTMLGVGWKYFRADFLEAVDAAPIRNLLSDDFAIERNGRCGDFAYADPFTIPLAAQKGTDLGKIEPALVRKGLTTILMREFEQTFEWSVSCLGYMVGSFRVPLKAPLLGGDVRPYGGIRLIIRRDRLEPELVAPL